jgi:hypothetical protein
MKTPARPPISGESSKSPNRHPGQVWDRYDLSQRCTLARTEMYSEKQEDPSAERTTEGLSQHLHGGCRPCPSLRGSPPPTRNHPVDGAPMVKVSCTRPPRTTRGLEGHRLRQDRRQGERCQCRRVVSLRGISPALTDPPPSASCGVFWRRDLPDT